MTTQIEVTIAEAAERHQAGATWIDVREPDEWATTSIAGTELIPLAGTTQAVLERYPDRSTELLVSCAVGGRSMRAVRVLRELGYVPATDNWRFARGQRQGSQPAAGAGHAGLALRAAHAGAAQCR